jgi:glycyl-tRNA synthetase beta chain
VISLSSANPLKTITARIDALKKFKEDSISPDFLLAVKRVNNILPETSLPPFKTALLLQEEEKNLYDAYVKIRNKFIPLYEKDKFYDGLKTLSQITSPVNTFFDKVLVMDKKEEIKLNRLALLKEIWSTASLISDFSKLH